jgi:Fe-Mn family superoxide dismutase
MFTTLLSILIMSTTRITAYTLPVLPYPSHALEPVISKATIENHHGKHFAAYVNNLNKLIPGSEYEGLLVEEIVQQAADGPIYNNAGQVMNHKLYFEQFIPIAQYKAPGRRLTNAINFHFGGMEAFKKQMSEAAMSVFGSGWVWLAMDAEGRLTIVKESGGGNPWRRGMTPILGIDCWEHSWYLDYAFDKKVHFDTLWEIMNWDVIESRLPL